MSWPFKDYDFYGDRFVNINDSTSDLGERMWPRNIPTECVICIEAEDEMYTKYAHPKAHAEAHRLASDAAEALAINNNNIKDYIEYYTFYYGRDYKKIYKKLYKKYKQEYSAFVLTRPYDKTSSICQYHIDSIQYYHELNMQIQ